MTPKHIDDDEYMEDMDADEISDDVELQYDEEEELLLDDDVEVELDEEVPSVLIDGIEKPQTEDDWRALLKEAKSDGTAESVPEYRISDSYKEGDLIMHPIFGLGVVSKTITPRKMEVVFENDKKLLAMNVEPPQGS
ncbi:hypothetical protein [Thermodesulforhabdus norvegica]|uniref:Uncharacterized protein n=1 Tax=Thermodesulforhabdus norvegica TaxID=39841 RepID=A0A1I4UMM5_9BACT|nr:hypothetical protein [Thermodesulforhabdus norvegica]SFM90254.1 hypothetical protein SAMN05660836_01884 [Thermodesulforhabdus norvegica]